MPNQFYIKSLNKVVFLEENPFASGGEGALYKVLKPNVYSNYVAKIYHPRKRTAQKQAKILYLIENPPLFETNTNEQEQPIVWAKHALYNTKDEFVGFLMPRADGEKLEILTSPKLPKYLGNEWDRFRPGDDEALRLRLKVCYNIAAALRTIHVTGKYVLVDLKPDNVIIKSNGLVSIVDTDSIEVIEDGKALFAATVATPEYTPAEYYNGVKPGQVLIDVSWDRFSLAVIFYRMLFGVHPFAATAKPPYDNINSLGDKIKNGLFVHNPELSDTFEVVPPPHKQFHYSDPELKKLFLKAFDDGFEDPDERPSAEEWGKAFMNNPLLLTNRSLPSKALKIAVAVKENWYELALEKATKDQNLVFLKKGTKQYYNANPTDLILQEASVYYKKAKELLWKAGKFGLWISLVLFVVFIIKVTLFATDENGFNELIYGFNIIGSIFKFIPKMFMDLAGMGILILIMLMPLLWASFRQFAGIAKNKTERVRKNMVGWFSFTNSQKKKNLEMLQYNYYNKRTQAKQRLREIKNELLVWSRVKNKKEKAFFELNNKKIVQSNREISGKVRAEKTALQLQDSLAKKLMIEESEKIKITRIQFQKQLDENAVFSTLKGKNAKQKISFLKAQKEDVDATWSSSEISKIIDDLEAFELSLETELAVIRDYYDKEHAKLLGESNKNKIKIDDLVKVSIDDMRQKTNIDDQLINGSFKRLLQSIKNLEMEEAEKEDELMNINQDLNQIKEELNIYK